MDPILVSAIAGAALLFFTRKKKKRSVAPPEPVVPPPEDVPSPPVPNHDAQMLDVLGYGSSKNQIWKFQNEFNYVQREFKIWDRQLKRDGVVGPNTRGALSRAVDYAKAQDRKWKDIVKDAKARGAKYKFYVGGKNLPVRMALAGKLKNAGLDTTVIDQADLAAWFFAPSWADSDALIVAVDVGNDELKKAWVAPDYAAGSKGTGMSLTEMGGKGVNQAISLGKS